MTPRALAALILATALVTLDGTAVNVALPSIGRDLRAGLGALQWITDASLVMIAVLLLPAGALADRFGRRRMMLVGLALFALASAASAAAPDVELLVAARFAQGVAAALILPGSMALLRSEYRDESERARAFGIWAGWSGLASAVGPLLGGALVDLFSWRAVFLASAALTFPTAALLLGVPDSRGNGDVRVRALLPAEMVRSRNCLAGNLATFAMYFGLFGLSFLLVIYTQDVLGYSGIWAGAALVPISLLMLLLSERFGHVATRRGPRALLTLGPLVAAAGLVWMALGGEPLAFWSRIIVGTALFGLGMAMTVAPLTHVAVSSVSHRCAGAASGLNNAVVRAAGAIAIVLVGAIGTSGASDGHLSGTGFRLALLVCAAVVGGGGALTALLVRDHERGGLAKAA